MKKKITIEFNSLWILSRQDDAVLPVQTLVDSLKEIYSAQIVENTLTGCELIIEVEPGVDEAVISKKIAEILFEKYGVNDLNKVLECTITDYKGGDTKADVSESNLTKKADSDNAESTLKTETAGALSKDIFDDGEALTAQTDEQKVQKILSKIDALVGAEEFKELAYECAAIAPLLIKHNSVSTFINRSYVFTINNGNGLSTYLELFADLLSALKIFTCGSGQKFSEVAVTVPRQGEPPKSGFVQALDTIRRAAVNGGRVICIDISEWMSKITDGDFREFLSILEDYTDKNIYVFKIPFVEKEILDKINDGISDILAIKTVSFVPFDTQELLDCAEKTISEMGFTMEKEAWDVFNTRLAEEKSDGRFYGINTLNKVIQEMIFTKLLMNATTDVDDTIIKKDEIISISSTYTDDDVAGIDMLDDYVGMEKIKERVLEIVAQIEMLTKNKTLGSPCIHMRFIGNPGTGKTTVARVIGKILKEKGVLRHGGFFEHSGRNLCGQFVGSTAPKTSAICRDAYGSVLFIDEAYSLYNGEYSGSVDYGREAIDTLIAEMENHRNDFVVIMAGYPEEMKKLMEANAGLESRMPYVIEFPNYTREQLTEIFMLMVKKSFQYADGFEEAVSGYFNSISDSTLQSKEFSNARFARNLFERTWGKAALRAQLAKEDNVILTKEDFFLASSEKEFSEVLNKETKPLGFI